MLVGDGVCASPAMRRCGQRLSCGRRRREGYRKSYPEFRAASIAHVHLRPADHEALWSAPLVQSAERTRNKMASLAVPVARR